MTISLRYLQSLLEYLKSFYRRAFPLKDMDSELETVIADFNKRWEKGQIEGWSEITPSSTGQDAGIWCDACRCFNILGTVCLCPRFSVEVVHLLNHIANRFTTSQANGHMLSKRYSTRISSQRIT